MITLQDLPPERVHDMLAEVVRETILHRLTGAEPGHCLRISTLPEKTMRDLCADLNANHPGADVVLLLGPRQEPGESWEVSATRLVELRNLELRPLLVFVPPGLKTAAEDSFDVSTFVEIDLRDTPLRIRRRLQDRLPEELRWLTDRAIGYLDDIERLITDDDIVRYYLTILHNQEKAADLLEIAGGALYQLHLIPDFDVYKIADRIKQRLSHNADALKTLIGSLHPLLGRIHELQLRADTIQGDLYAFLRTQILDDVTTWGAAIATEPDLRHLAFEQWQFEGEVQERGRLLLYVDDLDLPARDAQAPVGPDNPRYLDVAKSSSVRIKWETNPKPVAANDLAYFRIEIVSTELAGGAIVWESKNIPVGKSTQASRSKKLNVADFRNQFSDPEADGLYFFRVRAYSAAGEILNEEDPQREPRILRDPRDPEGKRHYESEDVWFWIDPQGEPPPTDPSRNVSVESFLEAQLLARLAAIDRGDNPYDGKLIPQPERTGWATARGKRAEATYSIVYDAQTRFTLTISSILREIESQTLRHPEKLGRWRLNLVSEHDRQNIEPTVRPYHSPGRVPPDFLQIRSTLFTAIQGGEADRLTSTVDLTDFADPILTYAQAYADWLKLAQVNFAEQAIRDENGRKRTDPLFLDLDVVELLLPGDGATPDRLYLLAPTHPLRLLWHLQRANLVNAWLRAACTTSPGALNANVRAYLRHGLAPVNLPLVFRSSHEGYPEAVSHFYVEYNPLTPFWGLYLREDVKDSRTLEARTLSALGISRRVVVPGEIAHDALTHNVLRYLVQHPYVYTLKVNVFNPGDASLIVDAILGVERERRKARLPELRYELRLFTHSERVENVGGAVDELLNPERQVSAEADAFVVASRNPLYPKLHFSRNSLKDFLLQPEVYEAHVSMLYDLFPVEAALYPLAEGRSSFLHGLIQEQVTRFAGDEPHYAWRRQLVPAPCQELPDDTQSTSARLAELLSQIAELQASVAAGKQVEAVPTLQLSLGLQDKNLLYQIHAVSDWVLTVDRHLGLDYFDSDASDDRPIYLLDFRPEFGGADTERLLLTTRSVDEIRQLIRPVLEDHDLLLGEDVEVYFLRLLRSLSGRLALKLLSAPTQVSEALGLALARLFLEQYKLLDDRIVIPLDAHSNLFTEASREDPLHGEFSLQRSDLLLVSCDPTTRTLRFQIVEVKFQADLGDFSAYVALQQRIEGQIANSEEVLRQHFDPHRTLPDRLDRQVKIKELFSLLSFYLARSYRYGLVSDTAMGDLRTFLGTLDEGYRLECTGAGLTFDLGHQGLEIHEEHPGLIFYRVGQDYVHQLLNNGLRRRTLLQQQTQEKAATIEESERQSEDRKRIVDDTTMHEDPNYSRVRTLFDITPLPDIAPPPIPVKAVPVPSDEPESEPATEEPPAQPQAEPALEVASKPPEPVQEVLEKPVPATVPAKVKELQDVPTYDVLLGDTGESRQFGLLGLSTGKRVALDLNGTNTMSLFGVQGSGKSYTVGSIIEMATQSFQGVNLLPSPLASVLFHYHQSQDYPPEFVSMAEPNTSEAEVEALAREYGALPARLEDVLILTSADKLEHRRAEFPSVRVEPIYFSSGELSFKDWRFLMGVGGTQMYMKQINMIMRQLRGGMTLDTLRHEIEASELSDGQKTIARIRLNFAAQFIDDSQQLANMLHPGRLVIVDLRDEFIDKEEALGLFVVMLNIFANARQDLDHSFNKLIVFDEAHKYMDNPELTGHIVDVIRQMRHQGVSILIASQDPPSLPNAIIELSSLVILHRFNSPQWLKHVQRSITALADLTPAQMAALRPGDAYVWAAKATERVFTQKAVKMRFRPRVTQHGGATKQAISPTDS